MNVSINYVNACNFTSKAQATKVDPKKRRRKKENDKLNIESRQKNDKSNTESRQTYKSKFHNESNEIKNANTTTKSGELMINYMDSKYKMMRC